MTNFNGGEKEEQTADKVEYTVLTNWISVSGRRIFL